MMQLQRQIITERSDLMFR